LVFRESFDLRLAAILAAPLFLLGAAAGTNGESRFREPEQTAGVGRTSPFIALPANDRNRRAKLSTMRVSSTASLCGEAVVALSCLAESPNVSHLARMVVDAMQSARAYWWRSV